MLPLLQIKFGNPGPYHIWLELQGQPRRDCRVQRSRVFDTGILVRLPIILNYLNAFGPLIYY